MRDDEKRFTHNTKEGRRGQRVRDLKSLQRHSLFFSSSFLGLFVPWSPLPLDSGRVMGDKRAFSIHGWQDGRGWRSRR